MSKPLLLDTSQNQLGTSSAQHCDLPNDERPHADVEMARVLETTPFSMASDPSSGAITHWKHEPLHDVVEPMADHVIMTYPRRRSALERRDGKIGCDWNGAFRSCDHHSGRFKLPMGYSRPVDVVQLYLPHTTLDARCPRSRTHPHPAIFWSERRIPTPLHPDCC